MHAIAGDRPKIFRLPPAITIDSEIFPVSGSGRCCFARPCCAVAGFRSGRRLRGFLRPAMQLCHLRALWRLHVMAEFEAADETLQFLRLLGQGMACRRRLFHHGGVLLGRLIHLGHNGIDLIETCRLFLGTRCDRGDDPVEVPDLGDEMSGGRGLTPGSTNTALYFLRREERKSCR
jgi:hypothetical protein